MSEYIKSPKSIKILFLLVVLILGTEYVTHKVNFLAITSFIGVFLIAWGKLIRKSDLKILLAFLCFNLGVIISKLLFTPHISTLVNTGFVLKTVAFALIVINYVNNYSIPKKTLLIISLFALPHFLGALLGILPPIESEMNYGRFGGFHGDPNYLSTDLLAALVAQLFIIKLKFSKIVQFLTYGNIIVTLVLIIYTGSRTAFLSTLIIFMLYLLLIYKQRKSTNMLIYYLAFPIILVFFGEYFLANFSQLRFLYDRFFYAEGMASLQQNERFITWGIAYETIINGALFKGYGMENFLENKYRFYSHNVFLNAGLRYGKVTFFAHLLLVFGGLAMYVKKFISGVYKMGFNPASFFFLVSVSQIFMMLSISVSMKYLYWFVLVIIITYGICTPKIIKKYNFSSFN